MKVILLIILVAALSGCSASAVREENTETPEYTASPQTGQPSETQIPQQTIPVQTEAPVQTPIPTEAPKETEKQKPKQEVLAEFSTSILSKDKNRTANLKTAAKAVNGKIVKKGEIFSFNQTVGPRTEEKGYKEASVLVGEEESRGIGGGVCQISTTIFNAAQKANLQIVERHKHQKEVAYAKNGTDATVNYNDLDMKFKNTSNRDIRINVSIKKNKVNVKITAL